MPDTMTALFGGAGPTWQIRDVDVPRPGPGQVLLRVHAVSLNNADLGMLDSTDEYLAGFEFAGEVAAIGPGADSVAIGQRVMGTTQGAFAQYVLADHRHVIRMPDSIDFRAGAALPTGLLTEHGALAAGGFCAGQSVLITGATSSVGLIGVQIATALGAGPVIATTRSAAKAELLQKCGATDVIVTASQELTATVLQATAGAGVDVVLDHVGGQTLADSMEATHVDGTLVNIGRLDGEESTLDLNTLSYRHLTLRGVSFGFTRADELADVIAALRAEVLPAVADGRITAVIDSEFDFEQAGAAAERLRSNQARGKIVLRVP